MMTPGYGMGDPMVASEANKWMIINIIIAGTCCLPLGGLGAYFAYEAKQQAERGMLDVAHSKLGTAKTMGIVGIVGAGVIIVFYIFAVVIGSV